MRGHDIFALTSVAMLIRSILADVLFIGLPVILFLIGLVWLIAQEVKG